MLSHLAKAAALSAIAVATLAATPRVCPAERHALVIGVNDCPQFRTGRAIGLRKLRGAEHDARLIAQTLQAEFGFAAERVTTLVGEAAVSSAVRAEMDRLARSLTADDQLVFYFAGHGTRRRDLPPEDELDDGLDEALCLHDTTPAGGNLLVDDDLRLWLASLRAARVTVILDCCHSGSGTKGSGGTNGVSGGTNGGGEEAFTPRFLQLSAAARAPALDPDRRPWTELTAATKAGGARLMALYACSNEQSAYERRYFDPKPTHRGQFTHHLLRALRDPAEADTNGDGRLSIGEASAYVSGAIEREFNARRRDPRRQQTPRHEAARDSWELIARQ
ncbi:MAG: caspase family protein [Planctomycetota bacterium]